MFTDTDSLVYEIKRENIFEDFCGDKSLLDFSGYPRDANLFDLVNKKVIGKMKDEFKGKIISEFVGLKSKIYSLVDVNGEENKKGKGVNKIFCKNIRYKEYINVLVNKWGMRHKMKRMQGKLHRIGTYDVCKISLSCSDDKRYILGDGINSLAYFHEYVKHQWEV